MVETTEVQGPIEVDRDLSPEWYYYKGMTFPTHTLEIREGLCY